MKLGDLLLEVNHYNPDDFHSQNEGQQQDTARLQMSIDLANTENSLIMQGKVVSATPYASPIHTKVHVEFTSSPTFQQLTKDDPRMQVMLDHITGEIAAQQSRTGQQRQSQNGQVGPSTQTPPNPMTNQNVMPNRIFGGEQQSKIAPAI